MARGTGTSSYIVYPSGSGAKKSFGYLKSARVYAQAEADKSGVSSIIYQYPGPTKSGTFPPPRTHHVYPKKKKSNPSLGIPRNKWVNAKIQVTSSGKILAQVASPLLATGRKRNKGGSGAKKPSKATIILLYNKFRREGYSVAEAERLAKLNAPYYERGRKSNRRRR